MIKLFMFRREGRGDINMSERDKYKILSSKNIFPNPFSLEKYGKSRHQFCLAKYSTTLLLNDDSLGSILISFGSSSHFQDSFGSVKVISKLIRTS